MDQEFITMYIDKIISEVTELTKVKLLLQTQLSYAEKQTKEAVELQNKLQQSNNELMEKVAVSVKGDRTAEFEQTIENIKGERASLQNECNHLRKKLSQLEEFNNSKDTEILKLKSDIVELKSKKKKVVSV